MRTTTLRRAAGALLLPFLLALPAAADTWSADKAHSGVGFEIRHLVSKVRGSFADFTGTVTGDLSKPQSASVTFTIKAASIDTNEEKRDAHLKSADFFDAEKFPEITFTSQSIRQLGKDEFAVTGPLTMHGVTKEVTLTVTLLGVTKDPWGNERAGLEATGTINRKDFGIVWNKLLDNGGAVLGDDVKVQVELAVVKKAEKPAEKAPEKKS